MFNKKRGLIILLLLIVCICAVSSVSAADNVSDTLTVDEAQMDEEQSAIEEVNEVADMDEDEKVSASEEDLVISNGQSGEVLSYILFPDADDYDISFKYSSYVLTGSLNDKKVYYSITPCKLSGYYAYDYSLRIYDGYTKNGNYYYWGNKIYDSGRIYGMDISKKTEVYSTVPAGTFTAGTFYMVLINSADGIIMDGPTPIKVTDNAVISAGDYEAFYNSGGSMSFRVTEKSTGNPLRGVVIKATFSNGVIKYYTTDANGYSSFVPPVGVGTYSVTFSPSNENLKAINLQKTVKVKKAAVKIKAKKVVEYKGFKTTLKATVTGSGKNVNEGKVAFKINGKTYKVNVKNGVATKKIKLKKVKTYKYSAKYLGTPNLKASKKVKAKATLKKRQKVKIKFKNPVVYMGQVKKVVVKITSKGKKVKSGLLYIKHKNGVDKVKITKGKVVLYAVGLASDHYKGTNGITTYYKKTVKRTFWMKYVPTEHKYKGVKVKYKATSKYKCSSCGKKGSHNHYGYGLFGTPYTYPIKVS